MKTYTIYRIDLTTFKANVQQNMCAKDEKTVKEKVAAFNAFSKHHKFDDSAYVYGDFVFTPPPKPEKYEIPVL
jgi:hypothetical protein